MRRGTSPRATVCLDQLRLAQPVGERHAGLFGRVRFDQIDFRLALLDVEAPQRGPPRAGRVDPEVGGGPDGDLRAPGRHDPAQWRIAGLADLARYGQQCRQADLDHLVAVFDHAVYFESVAG